MMELLKKRILIALLFCVHFANGQMQFNIDSLHKLLKIQIAKCPEPCFSDTTIAQLYYQISISYYTNNLDSMLLYSEKTLAATSIDVKSMSPEMVYSFYYVRSGAYNNIGFVFNKKGNAIDAIKQFNLALKIGKELNNKEIQSNNYNSIAVAYFGMGNITKAIDFFHNHYIY